MRAIVLADGTAPRRAAMDHAWPGWDRDLALVIAADGGARLADTLGLRIDRWVGDGDSLGADGIVELRARGLVIDLQPLDKSTSDTELGLLAAAAAGATSIAILGALGGSRTDHALANVALLGHPALAGRSVEILDEGARIRMAVGHALPQGTAPRFDLSGRIGDLVSLIPLEAATGVTTRGLRFALHDEGLAAGPSRGLSNIRTATDAWLTIEGGRVLVVESPATLSS